MGLVPKEYPQLTDVTSMYTECCYILHSPLSCVHLLTGTQRAEGLLI